VAGGDLRDVRGLRQLRVEVDGAGRDPFDAETSGMTGRGPGTAAPVVEALGPSLVLAAGGGRWPTRWTAPGCWAEADDGRPGMLHGELRIRI
jgi:hypothetical protein